MSRADGRVRPGQNITTAFSARAWNRAQDAADVVLGDRGGLAAGTEQRIPLASNIVLVKNTTGGSVGQFGVLGISGVEIDPSLGTFSGADIASGRARAFFRQPVLRGTVPNAEEHQEAFVVLLEPCADDGIARAAVGGCVVFKLQVVSSAHRFATILPGSTEQLRTSQCGGVHLLWKETGLGSNRWAVGLM